MAFTSDMIPRLVYMYAYQPDGEMNMKGYINNSLSVFNISEFSEANRPEDAENPFWFNSSITTCRCDHTLSLRAKLATCRWLSGFSCFAHANAVLSGTRRVCSALRDTRYTSSL